MKGMCFPIPFLFIHLGFHCAGCVIAVCPRCVDDLEREGVSALLGRRDHWVEKYKIRAVKFRVSLETYL